MNPFVFWFQILFSLLIQDKRVKEIVLKAMGQAISKAVAIAEILKVWVLYILQLCICNLFYT